MHTIIFPGPAILRLLAFSPAAGLSRRHNCNPPSTLLFPHIRKLQPSEKSAGKEGLCGEKEEMASSCTLHDPKTPFPLFSRAAAAQARIGHATRSFSSAAAAAASTQKSRRVGTGILIGGEGKEKYRRMPPPPPPLILRLGATVSTISLSRAHSATLGR